LPASGFNQYNVSVLSSAIHSVRSDFARIICRKFQAGRFLVVGAYPAKLERQFSEMGREAVFTASSADLTAKVRQHGTAAHFEIAIWFYPPGKSEDDRICEELSRCARGVVLVPGTGSNVARRRSQLVECFRQLGFSPDYGCDLGELDPGTLLLRHQQSATSEPLVSEVETAFARLNTRLSGVQRMLDARISELEGAHRHIARLEERLLKLKQYRSELKLLKEQRQALRKSPERRIGQVLLAPYRLPETLVKRVWKKLYKGSAERGRSSPLTEYQEWFQRHRATRDDLDRMRHEARGFATQPLISIITPIYDTSAQWLTEAVESVLAQAYENWELLLIDDGSSIADLVGALPALAARDQRIVLDRTGRNEGISAASNQALAHADGEWVALLDHDDVLEPDALFQIVKLLQTHPDADLIYTDEDKLSENGWEAPVFKPDWSPDLFRSHNYIGHLTAMRRELVDKVGGFRSEFDSAQDYDLLFRVIEQTDRIHHIPRVLYHWRRSASSSAISVRQKPGQLEASRFAIADHLKRRDERARVVVDWNTHAFCVRRELLEAREISVIISARHGQAARACCIESLAKKTSYPDYEIVFIQADNEPAGVDAHFSRMPHHLLRFSGAHNLSAPRNFAVGQTASPWILFLDDDMEVIESDWLTIMAEHIQRPDVGAVGAQLLNSNNRIEHAGIVLGVNGIAQLAFRGLPPDERQVSRQLQVTRNCSAVSAACMLTRRDVFQEVGGFDESLPDAFAEIDLCLKMRRAGYLIVYTSFAKLYKHEPRAEKIDMGAEAIMRERWPDVVQRDPYYNANLSRERADFSLGK
jgi:GT2 family glycosyltransferase